MGFRLTQFKRKFKLEFKQMKRRRGNDDDIEFGGRRVVT